ncbi:Uncharacterized protein GBIM_17548 [Gryllus bimaculatus]|nr:Uncharacterized protein GBIM_17548 [Gryllus bimaculatus]
MAEFAYVACSTGRRQDPIEEMLGGNSELHSSVEITTNQSFFSDCVIIQRELMPSGLYVNPDELADLQRTGQVSGCVSSEVDTEAAKETAQSHEVFIYYTLKQLGSKLTGNFVLPFHLRYHKPLPMGGEEEVVLEAPAILLKCNPIPSCLKSKQNMLAPCIPCSPEKCKWTNISYNTELG